MINIWSILNHYQTSSSIYQPFAKETHGCWGLNEKSPPQPRFSGTPHVYGYTQVLLQNWWRVLDGNDHRLLECLWLHPTGYDVWLTKKHALVGKRHKNDHSFVVPTWYMTMDTQHESSSHGWIPVWLQVIQLPHPTCGPSYLAHQQPPRSASHQTTRAVYTVMFLPECFMALLIHL